MRMIALIGLIIAIGWGVGSPIQTHAQDESYPVITAENVGAIQQLNLMSGDQGRIAVSPDHHWLAIGGLQGVWLTDLNAGDEEARFLRGHTDTVNTVAFHPDSQILASGSEDATIRLWDVTTGELIREIDIAISPIIGLDFDKSGQFLASASRRYVRIFLVETGEQIQILGDVEGGARRVEFVNNTPLLVAATFNGTLAVWDLNENRFVGELRTGINGDLRGISTSPDGTQVAMAIFSGRVILNTVTTDEQLILDYHTAGARDVQYSPNGRLVASTGMDNVALVMDAMTGELLRRFELKGFGYSLEFSQDSRLLYVASSDGDVTTWDVERDQLIEDRQLPMPTIRQVVFSPNNQQIAAVTDEDNLARIFDVPTHRQIAVLARDNDERMASISYRTTGSLLVTAGTGGDVQVWRTDTFELADTLTTQEDRIYSVIFTPDTNVIATGGERFIRLWNLRDKEEIVTINHGTTVWSLAISADGSLIAAPGGMWNVFTGERVDVTIDEFASVAFSPNSDFLATTDGFIPIETARLRRPRPGFVGRNNTRVAFSPDGTLVAMAVGETIDIIDVETQAILTTLTGHTADVRSLAFSPDGTRLVSGGNDATIRQWVVMDDVNTQPRPVAREGVRVRVMPDAIETPAITDAVLTDSTLSRAEMTVVRQAITNVVDLDVSPEGDYAVIASLRGVFFVDVNNLDVSPMPLLPTNEAIFPSGLAVDYADDGSRIAVSHGFARSEESIGGGITIWDVVDGVPTLNTEFAIQGDRGFSIALSNDNQLVALGFNKPTTQVINIATGQLISQSEEALFARITGLTFIPDDTVLSVSDAVGNKAFFETSSGDLIAGFNSAVPLPMVWSSDGQFLYSVEQGRFILRDGFSAEPIRTHTYPEDVEGDILTIDGHNGQLLVSIDDRVWFLDFDSGELLQTLTGFNSILTHAQVTQDGRGFIGVTNDNHFRVWDLETGLQRVDVALGFTDPQAPLSISDDGLYVAIANRGVTVRIFSARSGEFIRNLDTTRTTNLYFLPASRILATTGQDSTIEFWDVATGRRLDLLTTVSNQIQAISADGNYLVTRDDARTVTVHNTRNGTIVWNQLSAHLTRLNDVTFFDDLMATGGADGVVKLWDIQDREQVKLLFDHQTGVKALTFAPTETLLATVGEDGVTVYDYRPLSNVNQRFVFSLSVERLNGLYFSVDSRLLFVHQDGELHVWSMEDGRKLNVYSMLDGISRLTRDGRSIVSVDASGTIQRIAVPTTDEMD